MDRTDYCLVKAVEAFIKRVFTGAEGGSHWFCRSNLLEKLGAPLLDCVQEATNKLGSRNSVVLLLLHL